MNPPTRATSDADSATGPYPGGSEVARIQVDSPWLGLPRVIVNGSDLAPAATDVTLQMGGGFRVPVLTVGLHADVALDMTGVVRLYRTGGDSAGDAGEVVAAWLRAVDVAQLEHTVAVGASMRSSPVEVVLDALLVLAVRTAGQAGRG